MSENHLEKPVPDSLEQQRALVEGTNGGSQDEPTSVPLDVNEADAVEQHREVELDEDDYR
ncbi:MAG TPA: hypothetical protein VGS19_30535 [Streptosporangiaceae bacterium]|nr:hypothetical protein [Streptosporangiaceae bacterium]